MSKINLHNAPGIELYDYLESLTLSICLLWLFYCNGWVRWCLRTRPWIRFMGAPCPRHCYGNKTIILFWKPTQANDNAVCTVHDTNDFALSYSHINSPWLISYKLLPSGNFMRIASGLRVKGFGKCFKGDDENYFIVVYRYLIFLYKKIIFSIKLTPFKLL